MTEAWRKESERAVKATNETNDTKYVNDFNTRLYNHLWKVEA